MKVQIEIKEEALSIAVLSIGTMAKSDTDSHLLEQAVERCKNEVTEIDIEKHDEDMSFQIALALIAITQQGENIENESMEQ
ncbi:MAG: hypothetical protein IKN32_10170 [Bacteroidales bacterium]|nr:hypothetical protein [Bacteroidales bacterium]